MVGRTKASSFKASGSLHDGETIMNLPPKTTRLIKVDFSTEDRAFYDKLEADSRSQFEEEKKKMVASAFGEDPCGSSATRLTAEDLIFLWNSSPKE